MDWNQRIRAVFGSAEHVPDDDVIEELAQHVQALYETSRADGLSREGAEAKIAELMQSWSRDPDILRHGSHRTVAVVPPAATSSSRVAGLVQDVRYAARLLIRDLRFVFLAVITIGVGIAATTVLFNLTYRVLLKPLPWPDADRVVTLKETRGGRRPRFMSFTNAAYLAWREKASTVEDFAAWSWQSATLTGAGDAERIQIVEATPSLFGLLGVRPLAGSFFTEREVGAPVVVLSESLWRERFGGDGGAIGRVVRIDAEARTVIGVLPREMAYPNRQARAWIPFEVRPATGNFLSMFNALAKLRPGVTPAQAAAEGTARGHFAADTGMTTTAIFGGQGAVEISAMPLHDAVTGDVRRPLLLQLGAVVLLLLIATTNVASLQLARAVSRRREIAIRAALGASGTRLVQQLFTESLLLGLAGGGAGLALSLLLHRALAAILPADFPRLAELSMDARVVLVVIGLSILVSIFFGLLPAVRVQKLNLVEPLSEDGSSPVGVGTRAGVARTRLWIIAGQVAVSAILLVGAALLARTFLELRHADRGLDPSRVLGARLVLPAPTYAPTRRHELIRGILERLTTGPAARPAAFTSEHPLTPGGSTASFVLPWTDAEGRRITAQASPRIVSHQYFSTLGLRVVSGRTFADSDNETSQPVTVVNETFARRYLAGRRLGDKISRSFWRGEENQLAEIIGIVEDVKYIGGPDLSQPEMYVSYRQLDGAIPITFTTLLVRVDADAASAARDLRRVVREADDGLAAEAVITLEDRLLSTSLARPRLYAWLLGSFAAIGLLLTGVGLFAALSHTVAQRTRELGLRAALGATRGHLVRLVIVQGLAITVLGLVVGLALGVLAARLAAALLYGVSPGDITTYAVVAVVISAVAFLACLVPAYRAARLEPLRALRS